MASAAALFHVACGGLWASLWAASAASQPAAWHHLLIAAAVATACYLGLCALGRLALQARSTTSWLVPLVFVASPLIGGELGHNTQVLWWMLLLLGHALATVAAAGRPGAGGLGLTIIAAGFVATGTVWCGASFCVALALPFLWSWALTGRARWRARGQGLLVLAAWAAWGWPLQGVWPMSQAGAWPTAALAAKAWGPPALVVGALMVADPRPLRRFRLQRLWRDAAAMPWNAMALLGAVGASFGEADEQGGMMTCAPYAAMGLSALAEPAAGAAAGMLKRSKRMRRRVTRIVALLGGAALLAAWWHR